MSLTGIFTDIASAIRSGYSSTFSMYPSQMASYVRDMPTAGELQCVEPFEYISSTITSVPVSAQSAQYVLNYAFTACTNLTTISFPNCSYIGTYAFQSCFSLTTASFPNCSYIGSGAFGSCTMLSSLYLPTSSVPLLANLDAFSYSPLSAGGAGKIYVKSSLLSSFEAATNWSMVSARLVGM